MLHPLVCDRDNIQSAICLFGHIFNHNGKTLFTLHAHIQYILKSIHDRNNNNDKVYEKFQVNSPYGLAGRAFRSLHPVL